MTLFMAKKIVRYVFNDPEKYTSEKTKQNYKKLMDFKLPNCPKPAPISNSVS